MDQSTWAVRQARTVAAEVRRRRQALGMSQQALADRTAEMGHAIPRSVLANLEHGRRDSVSTADLLVLAFCLEMPPIELLIPVGSAETVEVLPGLNWPFWQAVVWLTGEGSPGVDTPPRPVQLYRRHAALLEEWHRAVELIARAAALPGEPDADHTAEVFLDMGSNQARRLEELIAKLRARLRRLGLLVPPLPPRLAFLDDEERGQ